MLWPLLVPNLHRGPIHLEITAVQLLNAPLVFQDKKAFTNGGTNCVKSTRLKYLPLLLFFFFNCRRLYLWIIFAAFNL